MLYSSEHGPSTDDEINIITKGRNYGWPTVMGYCDQSTELVFCNDSNVVEPIQAWTPTVATSGICYYHHSAIGEWQNSILLSTLKNQRIYALRLNSTHDSVLSLSQHFTQEWPRLRNIETNSQGEVFIATNENPGRIIKLFNPLQTKITERTQGSAHVKAFPNPADQYFRLNGSYSSDSELFLYDIKGKLIETRIITKGENIEVSSLHTGLYLLELRDDTNVWVEKLLVQH
jgi:hypothetical protein